MTRIHKARGRGDDERDRAAKAAEEDLRRAQANMLYAPEPSATDVATLADVQEYFLRNARAGTTHFRQLDLPGWTTLKGYGAKQVHDLIAQLVESGFIVRATSPAGFDGWAPSAATRSQLAEEIRKTRRDWG